MNIVILDGYTISRDDLDWSALSEFGKVTFYEHTAPEKIVARMAGADIVLTSKCIIDKRVIDLCPDLKYIGVLATGYNNIDLEYAKEKDIVVTNIPAYSSESVAQFTFALLLEIANQVAKHNDAVQAGEWQKVPDFCFTVTPQMELMGKTIGIVGYGNIGKQVADIAECFGMKVIINSRSKKRGSKFVSLEEIFERSDIISLHCPLNEDTQGLINKENIAKMKEDVIILNLSRGGLVVEEDLATALKSKRVAAAGLDVLAQEPPKDGSPLFGIENCIITPHIAWATKEARERLIDLAASNVKAFQNGKRQNRVI